MSSILKALRKLEEEKAALGEGGVDIARDILKRSASKSHKSLFWPLTSAILFALLLGVGAFFGVVKHSSESTDTAAVMVVAPVVPELAETAAKIVAVPDPVVATPVIPLAKKDPFVPKQKAQNPDKSAISVAIAPLIPQASKPEVKTIVPVQAEAISGDGLPFLRLTGIAYREKATERIAILNDLPVMQGTSIEGAQVIEIFPDHVVLQWQGKRFEKKVQAE